MRIWIAKVTFAILSFCVWQRFRLLQKMSQIICRKKSSLYHQHCYDFFLCDSIRVIFISLYCYGSFFARSLALKHFGSVCVNDSEKFQTKAQTTNINTHKHHFGQPSTSSFTSLWIRLEYWMCLSWFVHVLCAFSLLFILACETGTKNFSQTENERASERKRRKNE